MKKLINYVIMLSMLICASIGTVDAYQDKTLNGFHIANGDRKKIASGDTSLSNGWAINPSSGIDYE